MINRITPSSPLRRLGIRNGDVVVSINDQPVGELGDIFGALMEVSEGEALSLNIKRRGRERQIDFLFE
jgi:S1-C subfamily serine protease